MDDVQELDQPTVSLSKAIGKMAAPVSNERQRVERLPGTHLDMEMGSSLLIKLPNGNQKNEGKLLGKGDYSFLIVQARLPQDVATQLSGNPAVIAQHLAAGAVYGFRSEVMNRITVPAQLLFLAYPESVERIVLRRANRVKVSVPGNLLGRYGDYEVMLTDLASTGCQITAAIDLRSSLREAQIGDELVLNCDLGRGQTLLTPIRLCRVSEAKGLFTMGCQFINLNDETSSSIKRFLQSVLKFSRSS